VARLPQLSFLRTSKIIVPITYSYKQYLVYILKMPLFSPTQHHLYKLLPFPITFEKIDSTYTYIGYKELFFSDALRQHYETKTANELTECFQPTDF
jgi:hypothetical protein